MAEQDVGLIGLAVMGQNLVLNMVDKGFSVAVYNRTSSKTEAFAAGAASGKDIVPTYSIEEFVGSLRKPRRIVLMVKAGAPVDAFIETIKPHMEAGDVLMDGGNSFFGDTERRLADLKDAGIEYIGMGVSGGEEGARHGPCIMPGGSAEAYKHCEEVLTKVAAQIEQGPCCTYIGPRGAGHYVKMVHNGIEYGIMQAIAEAYDILGRILGLKAAEISQIFAKWNDEGLGGYLMEIATLAAGKTDPDTGKPMLDIILDKAGQKGTGKWTSQLAFDIGVPVPTIDSATIARVLSAFKEERVAASKVLDGPSIAFSGDADKLTNAVRDALFGTMISSYAQGMAQLRLASAEYDYDLKLDEVAQIWKGGCIIRSKLLEPIRQAFTAKPDLPNLLVDANFSKKIQAVQDGWRLAVTTAIGQGVPCLTLGASLAYFDTYRTARVPANMIQALRDIFGAHTYKRVDKDGDFHTEWLK